MFENFGGGSEPATSQHATPTSDLPSPQEIDLGRGVQLAQATPAGEPIGAVEELLGAVVLTRADGSTSAAAPGTPVYLNDVVTTPVGGAVEIRFVDGTRFSLGQDGEMTLDQLVYNPGGGGNELDLSVAQGAFTFVTGAIAGAPGEGMEVRVPVGTIGIRGTAVGGGPDFSTADPTDYTVVLLPEPGGRVGRIVLTDLFGRSVILDDALEGMDISSLGLAPGEPVQLTREQVIALLGLSIENIEDILNEVENFQLEESPEDDVIPEGGPEQEGQLFNNVPNQGGVRTFAGRTLSLGELTSLLTIGDQQGFGDRSGGPLGGFDPDGGLGNDGNDGGPDDGNQGSDGPLGSDDPIIDDGGEQPAGFILLTGGDGDDLLDASGFAGPTNITGNGGSDILFGSEFDDILNGGDGDDLLDAGAGNDQVNGGGGDDILIGGSGQGNDALDGGAGNDWVVYTSATQPITVNLGAGIAFGDPAIGSDTLANIENVIGGKGSDSITGNGEDNVLMGGEGGDTLTGLGGDDALFGGAGNDTAVFTGNRDDYTIEVAQGEGGFFITDNRQGAENDGTDFVAEDIEVLRFADGDVAVAPWTVDDGDTISEAQQSVGNVLSNDDMGGGTVSIASVSYDGNLDEVSATAVGSIVTYAATDGSWKMEFDLSTGDYVFTVLEGLDHSDSSSLSFPFTYTVVGIAGATSSATLTIAVTDGMPNAVADFATATEDGAEIEGNVLSNDSVGLDGAWVTSITVNGQTYGVGIEPAVVGTLLGGELLMAADGLWTYTPPSDATGSESFAYTIIDEDGSTSTATIQIIVTDGSPSINGTPGNDNLVGTLGDDYIFGLGGDDILTGLAGNDFLDGGAGTDFLQGDEGSDELHGGDGNDFLYGGDGDDHLYGNAGDDFLDGGPSIGDQGYDYINGGDGSDYVTYSNATAGVTVNLASGTADEGGTSDILVSIENVFGSTFNDTITGDANTNYLYGDAGNDTLNGGGGDDFLYGGAGSDVLHGGEGNDVLIGDGDADELYGDGGDDVLTGTGGVDTLSGGEGNDTISIDSIVLGENSSIDGGAGFDTLFLTGADLELDITDGFSITNVERIWLVGSGANNVSLTVDDVLNKFNGVLEIVGDGEDSVTSLGQDWESDGQETRDGILFNHYTAADGTASLYVSADSNLDPNVIMS